MLSIVEGRNLTAHRDAVLQTLQIADRTFNL